MNPDHPRFEDLSAHHDGEAPEWGEHLAVCESCRSLLGDLATLSEAVARESSPQLTGNDRDDAVTRAVAAANPPADTPFGHEAGTAFGHEAGPERRRRWALAVGAAAVLVISIGVGAVVASKGPHRQMTRDALGTVTPQGDRAADGTRADAVVVAGDLGDIRDRAALVARVGTDLRARAQGQPPAAVPNASPAPSPGAADSAGRSSGAEGTPPCEVEARGDPGDRGEVVYQATAEEAGTAAVVLAFRSTQKTASITVEMRARSDCRLLLQGAIL